MGINNHTILIVDDSANNIKILRELLRDFHLKVALNGHKALQIASGDTPPDLILLDIIMPEMDGYEVCKRLKENVSTKSIPIIFLTAKYEKEDVVRGFECGAKDFISKPFDPKELLARVQTQLELVMFRTRQVKMKRWLEETIQERTQDFIDANMELKIANEQLQELDKAKLDFLQIASHEIRTPLNGIFGSLWLLQESGNQDLKVYFDMLDTSVKRLERFTQKALLATELRASNYKIRYEPCKLNDFIKIASDQCSNEIQEKKISMVIDPGANLEFDSDPKLLQVSISEIIANAIKYSKEGGQVLIKTEKLQDRIIFECIDEGKGFNDKAIKHLFELLRPGEQHIDENIGLSLAIVKMIMNTMKGTIEVGNNDVKGAWVKLSFPRNHE